MKIRSAPPARNRRNDMHMGSPLQLLLIAIVVLVIVKPF